MSEQKKNIVIIGGGIIGSTTAYFLSRHPKYDPSTHNITLLEATKIAGGASGKAGGLLALWAYPSCIVPLSYQLHKELADKYGGAERWGYRAVHCGQLDTVGQVTSNSKSTERSKGSIPLQKRSKEALELLHAVGVPNDLDWVDAEGISGYAEMGDPTTTAQVHPYQFTTSMASLAEEKGVKIVYGSAHKIRNSNGTVSGITYTTKETNETKTLDADIVILTAGPWTKTVLPRAPISTTRTHSVTIKPSREVSAFALFTNIKFPKGKRNTTVNPEIYARPNNEVYVCGEGDHLNNLPTTTDLVQWEESRCQDIIDHASSISAELRDGEVTAKQACYLPHLNRSGGPLIGETNVKGLFIGAGHTVWGIQNGPGTGKCLAEAVMDGGTTSADLESLDPKKYFKA